MDAPVKTPAFDQFHTDLVTRYTWDYADEIAKIRELYEKAKDEQWNARSDLDWDACRIDWGRLQQPENVSIYGSDIWNRLTEPEQIRLAHWGMGWTLCQFLHGEQGALLTASQLVASTDGIASKYYAASQVMDEARHVEAFQRFTYEKVGKVYGIDPNLRQLLDLILKDSRWDFKFLGMQVLVEGLALGAFGLMRQMTPIPLFRELLTRVMRDEARHVSFGLVALAEVYREMPERDRAEREEFALEGCRLMKERLFPTAVWEEMGLPIDACYAYSYDSPPMRQFRSMLFTRIMPVLKKIGLLSERIRPHFDRLGLLQYENLEIHLGVG